MTATASSYPLRFDVEYPERLSRWKIFVKWLLAIPHIIVMYVLAILAMLFTFIAFFAILFTKRYPQGLFNFVVGFYRWNANVGAYVYLLRDEYPPFTMDAGRYPVTFEVDYPESLSRWLIFVKWLLAIANMIVLSLVGIVAVVLWVVAWFAILFTGRIPRGIFGFLVGYTRWNYRLTAYLYLMTDKYPPFSLS
jgi:hypothetical protein